MAMTSFLLNLFDTAIAYLTFAIIGLFLAAMALKFKGKKSLLLVGVSSVRKTPISLNQNLGKKNIRIT